MSTAVPTSAPSLIPGPRAEATVASAPAGAGHAATVIVGYGHAGRDVHHRALETMFGPGHPVVAVDPQPRDGRPGAPLVPSLPAAIAAIGGDLASAIVHVTTPPIAHVPCVEDLVRHGARRIVLEKPVADSAAGSARLRELAADAHIEPVSVWPHSRITDRVVALMRAATIGRPTSLRMEQSKPRFARSAASHAHQGAFDTEMPHQVLLALYLASPVTAVTDACTWPMVLAGGPVPTLGGAVIRLVHANGVTSTLTTDLTATVRRRHLDVTGTGGEIHADYPLDAHEPYGQVRLVGQPSREILRDAPLDQFLRAAYHRFRTDGPPLPAGLDLHHRVIEILDTARAIAVPIDLGDKELLEP